MSTRHHYDHTKPESLLALPAMSEREASTVETMVCVQTSWRMQSLQIDTPCLAICLTTELTWSPISNIASTSTILAFSHGSYGCSIAAVRTRNCLRPLKTARKTGSPSYRHRLKQYKLDHVLCSIRNGK